jgi:hypothetical protein
METNDKPKVTGITTINHNKRVRLNLSCSDYVVADFLSNLKFDTLDYYENNVYSKIGCDIQQYLMSIHNLSAKGIIVINGLNTTFLFTDLWKDKKEYSFEDFWSIKEATKGKAETWPGSKKRAQQLFEKRVKVFGLKHIMKAKDEYFKYLGREWATFDRPIMGAPVFLGPDERFNEDWASLKRGPSQPSPEQVKNNMSVDDYKELYK